MSAASGRAGALGVACPGHCCCAQRTASPGLWPPQVAYDLAYRHTHGHLVTQAYGGSERYGSAYGNAHSGHSDARANKATDGDAAPHGHTLV